MKRLTKSTALMAAVGWLISIYIRFVRLTSRWRVIDGDKQAGLTQRGEPFIMAIWHGRIGMVVYTIATPKRARPLISHHVDGEMIARTMMAFGYRPIRGSTTNPEKDKEKGGAGALRDMVRALKDKDVVMLTPDGPRGPRMRASAGTIKMAQLSGVPVFPVSFSMGRRRVAKSWDKFIIPLPFSEGVFVWGEPMGVPRRATEEELETLRIQLEQRLNEVSARADRLLGHTPIEPEPLDQQDRSL